MKTGLATLAVSVLGLGVAASSLTPSSAQGIHGTSQASAVVTSVAAGVEQPSAFHRDAKTISRSNFREALTDHSASERLDSNALTQAADQAAGPAHLDERAVQARARLLTQESAAASVQSEKLETKKAEAAAKKAEAAKKAAAAKKKAEAAKKAAAAKKKAEAAKKKAEAARKAKKKAEAAKKTLGTATAPVAKYTVAARFGDVGSWARYHTGFDFSAPVGAKIFAPTAGVVRYAGSGGEAAGWAGNYVVLEHPDGTKTLYAHMSSISVSDGENVQGGTQLGRVGMSGRSFGPHLHFEVYPKGATPGDIYKAIDPKPWLNKLGIRP